MLTKISEVRFVPKVGPIGTKWAKSGTFRDKIFVQFSASHQNVLKSDLKKSPGFVPFGANLIHFDLGQNMISLTKSHPNFKKITVKTKHRHKSPIKKKAISMMRGK